MSYSNIHRAVASGLCIGCGACETIAPAKVHLEAGQGGFLTPVVSRPLSPAEDSAVGRICPGLMVEAPEGPHTGVWGTVQQTLAGFATDSEIRHCGSSGGALTAVAVDLLSSGTVDVVVCTTAANGLPFQNVPLIATSSAELVHSAGSRYAPAAPVRGLSTVPPGARVAFVGKPCDVAAARALVANGHLPALELSVCLSFLCAGTPDTEGTAATLAAMGVEPDDVREFSYRGNGWPGDATAVTDDGEYHLGYDESWGRHLGPRVHKRCKYCADGIGLSADLVFGDAWHLEGGRPSFAEAPGESLVVVRTSLGRKVLDGAESRGNVALESFDVGTLEFVQEYQAHRRRYVGARLLGLAVLGRQRPRYSKSVFAPRRERRAKVSRWLRELAGTIKRVVRAWAR